MLYNAEHFTATRDWAGGITLCRNYDGARCYFQAGDDAAAFEAECTAFDDAYDEGRNVPDFVVFGEYFA